MKRYAFDPACLDRPRAPGISALLRVRNGGEFLRLAIESHLPHYDEIVCCYNDCSDDTPAVLRDLAACHPERVRVFHYVPRVHPPGSAEHRRTPDGSLHGLANYYNWALARARYSVAVKLDDDHLAASGPLARCVATIRADLARGRRGLYTFSGLNLVRDAEGRLAVYGNQPFAGTGDIMYFPVTSAIHWRQAAASENLVIGGRRPPKQYEGLLFFHLKHLKADLGFGNFDAELRRRRTTEFHATLQAVPLAEFCSPASIERLRRGHNPLEYRLRTHPLLHRLLLEFADRHPPLRIARLWRLPEDLAALDWRALHAHLPERPPAAMPAAAVA